LSRFPDGFVLLGVETLKPSKLQIEKALSQATFRQISQLLSRLRAKKDEFDTRAATNLAPGVERTTTPADKESTLK